MTPSLRKYHRWVWTAFCVLLPLFYVSAILAIPKETKNPSDLIDDVDALPQIILTQHSPFGTVHIRKDNAADDIQLEVILIKPINEPETLVYLKCTDAEETEKVLIGTLSSKRTYHYALTGFTSVKGCTLEFFNPFSNATIHSIQL